MASRAAAAEVNREDDEARREAGDRPPGGATTAPPGRGAQQEHGGEGEPRRPAEAGAEEVGEPPLLDLLGPGGATEDPERQQREAGQQEPVLETQDGWRYNGVEMKARLDFGVDVVDYRGAVTNAGA